MKAVLAQAERCYFNVKPPKIMQHIHGIIPFMFDSWTHPVVHLLLRKSSTSRAILLVRQSRPNRHLGSVLNRPDFRLIRIKNNYDSCIVINLDNFKNLGNKFSYKSSQNIYQFLGEFWTMLIISKYCFGHFLGTLLEQIGPLFPQHLVTMDAYL